MLLPLPAMSMPSGAPSEYVLSRKPVMLAILIFQTTICIMRMVLLLDILGGFIMAICIGFGWYAYRESMHITFICYWGMMCLVNGVFDLVKLIDHCVKAPMPIFSSEMSFRYNLMSFTLMAVPFVTLPGAVLSWYMYKSHDEADSGIYRYGRPQSGASQNAGSERSRLLSSSGGGGFHAFGGSGQRLGGH
mmetsp:Transcript_44979/g.104034  ORF Transcript_44979/g.104034 Transcript_44979/m.104034 type:complete len:190 (+) Transcript_44979:104-673(+)